MLVILEVVVIAITVLVAARLVGSMVNKVAKPPETLQDRLEQAARRRAKYKDAIRKKREAEKKAIDHIQMEGHKPLNLWTIETKSRGTNPDVIFEDNEYVGPQQTEEPTKKESSGYKLVDNSKLKISRK